MRWDAPDVTIGVVASGVTVAAVLLFLFRGVDTSAAAEMSLRPGMTRAEVAARLGTDGEDDPSTTQFFVKQKQNRDYTGPCHTISVRYGGDKVISAQMRAIELHPKTWPPVWFGFLAFFPLACGVAELSGRVRRRANSALTHSAARCA